MAKVGIIVSDMDNNPTLSSENSELSISFYQTRESLYSPELYSKFIKNAVKRFRSSPTYTNYKHTLIESGFDCCAIQSNLTAEHCTIEMHHNILTIFDLTFIICEHLLNTVGKVSTFDLVRILKAEHCNNQIPLVMLTVTGHELNHDNDEFFIHPDITFGDWISFLNRYNRGITPELAGKLIRYLNRAESEGGSTDGGLLKLRDHIYDWSTY